MEVKKAVFLIPFFEKEIFPESRVFGKEFFLIGDKVLLEHLISEIKESGIKELIFLLPESRKEIFNSFFNFPKLKELFAENFEKEFLQKIEELENYFKNFSISLISQQDFPGIVFDFSKLKRKLKKEPFLLIEPSFLYERKCLPLIELLKVFRTAKKPTLSLKKFPFEKKEDVLPVKLEKIAHKFYKIRKIGEFEKEGDYFWGLSGRYLLTCEIISFYQKEFFGKGELISLKKFLKLLLEAGEVIYGVEISGNLFTLKRKIDLIKTNLYFLLSFSEYSKEIKGYLKKMI